MTRRSRRNTEDHERGSTLIEILAAVAVMGISCVAILVGTSTTLTSANLSRQETTASIVARDYSEALAISIPSGSSWCSSSAYTVSSYTPPSGFTVSNTPGTCPSSSSSTPQLQNVTITVNEPGGGTESIKLVVREP